MAGMKISGLDFVRLLPAFMRDDEAVIALSKAVNELMQAPGARLNTIRTWDQIDNLNEAECDEMAWELAIDWYDSTYPLDVKRSLIKNYIITKRKNGTKAALLSVLRSIFKGANVEEWFEYGGQPFGFRLEVEIPENGVTAEQQRRALENIKYYKNVRSWLEGLNYTHESHGEVKIGAYAAVATQIEIWPELVESLELTAEVEAGSVIVTQSRLEIYPAIVENLDITAKVETGGAVVAESRLEIYPETAEGLGLTAEATPGKSINGRPEAHPAADE